MMKMKGAKTLCMIIATAAALELSGCSREKYLESRVPYIGEKQSVAGEVERIENAAQFERDLMAGRTNFSNTDLSGLDVSGIDFKKYHEQYGPLNFSNADMRGINISGAYLAEANLSGAYLEPFVKWE